jgi:integrating conjugative element membrane protein (TIGR03747 family)
VASRNAAFHDGALASLLLSPLKLVFSLTLGLVVLLLCVWIIDWLFVFKFWPQGIERLREHLAHDLASGITLSAEQGGSASAITAPANALYAIVFEASGIHDMGTQFADGGSLSIPDTIVRRGYVSHREEIETAMLGTQLLGVRVAILARFAPLLLLLYAVGAADGLAQRAIRRACGGRESASLYHRAKYLQMAALGLGGLALLIWPAPVQWQLCVSLCALLTCGLASVQWAYYKKHL